MLDLIWFDFWCLIPLSAIFQLYHGKFDVRNWYVYTIYLQRDIDSANCLMLEIDLHEEENIELDEDSVDSDNEYVRDSNYSIIKQVWELLFQSYYLCLRMA